MLEGLHSGLNQGGLVSVLIVAILALLTILFFSSIIRLGAALARIGCILIVFVAFLYALARLFGV